MSDTTKWQVAQHPKHGGWCVLQVDKSGGMHSLGCRSKEDAEAKLAEWAAIGTCRECGDVLNDGYMPPYKAQIRVQQTCFLCLHWLKCLALLATSVRVNGFHYTISPDAPKGYRGFVGHGGARFEIRFTDGREVVTENLWAQGSIPDHFRERTPDNAVFVKRGHRYIGAFAGYGGAGSADADCETV